MTSQATHPGPWAAVWLTLAAAFTSQLLALLIAGPDPSPGVGGIAIGVGLAAGYGGLGTLAARRVTAPADVRLGLRGSAPAYLLPVLLLVPVVLLVSELDNVAHVLFPPPPLPPPDPNAPQARALLSLATPLDLLESAVLVIGLVPLLHEWFFRGVLLQGLVAHLGPAGGLALTALLSAFASSAPLVSFPIWLAAVLGAFVLGVLQGSLRLASGSILPAIALHMGASACGLLGEAFAERVPIPGFNAPGPHSPPALLAAALASCFLGVALLRRLAARPRPGA